jgi:glyoxylase I family protein
MAEFPAIGHVAVTVTDLDRSREWYTKLLGVEPVLDEDAGAFYHVVYPLGGTLLGLHTLEGTPSGDRFDERRVGLDHVSFGVGSRSDLEAWEQRLNELGIANGGIVDAPYGSGVSFRDPDNIALEFFAPPG